jgi:thymidine phosphorylase
MLVRIGDVVTAGQPLVRIFAPFEKQKDVTTAIANSIAISETQPPRLPLIIERVCGNDLP